MAIKTLYHNNETIRTVIFAIQEGETVIGWLFEHGRGAGAIFDPSQQDENQLRYVQDVSSALNELNPANGLLIKGNAGIGFAKGILTSTHKSEHLDSLADDYIEQLLTR